MTERKERNRALEYVGYFAAMSRVAEACGYTLALHGSLARDLDLVAIAWRPLAVSPEALLAAFVQKVDGLLHFPETEGGAWTDMPHGRRAVTILLAGGGWIDLSVIPPRETPAP